MNRLKAAYRAFRNPAIVKYWDDTSAERTKKYLSDMEEGFLKLGDCLHDFISEAYPTDRSDLSDWPYNVKIDIPDLPAQQLREEQLKAIKEMREFLHEDWEGMP